MNNLKSVFLIILLLYSCQTSQTLIRDNSDLLNNKDNPIFIYQNG